MVMRSAWRSTLFFMAGATLMFFLKGGTSPKRIHWRFPKNGIALVDGFRSGDSICEVVSALYTGKQYFGSVRESRFDYSPYGMADHEFVCDENPLYGEVGQMSFAFVQNRLYKCAFYSGDSNVINRVEYQIRSFSDSQRFKVRRWSGFVIFVYDVLYWDEYERVLFWVL